MCFVSFFNLVFCFSFLGSDVYFLDATLATCVLVASVRDHHTLATRTRVTKILSTKYT
jgi:tellurite resistance protein